MAAQKQRPGWRYRAHFCAALCRSDSGSVLALTALLAPIMIIMVGFGIDYGYASYLNQRLARACDTATLGSASQTAATTVGGYGNTTALQQYGTKIFNENVRDLSLSNVQFQLNVSQSSSSGAVTAAATYSYSFKTFMSGFFGVPTIPLSGSITASVQPPVYINYYLLVDVSNSMGIGATQADMTALYNKLKSMGFTQQTSPGVYEHGCVFACHNPNGSLSGSQTTEQVARQIGATLRVDSAVAAIKSIINSAASVAGTTKNISFGLYLMESSNSSSSEVVSLQNPPSNNYSNLLTQAGTIDLADNASGKGDTSFQDGFNAFNNLLPANGSGASASSPLNYVFFITDGVNDALVNSNSPTSAVTPVNPSWCSQIQAKATVGVIYTTYLPIWFENDPTTNKYSGLYAKYVYPIKDQISPNLQNCATSSDWFFEAVDGPAIVSTMQTLFANSQPIGTHLTQ